MEGFLPSRVNFFTGCNNKVIGARFYHDNPSTLPSIESPVDEKGHGSLTLSIAAGVSIAGANLYGLAEGTARGGVPSARIAMYKVCWLEGCSDVDLLAGMDDAINDGVDLISISIGGPATSSYFDDATSSYLNDPIAIGAFHAMMKGILTTCSAGNDGPYASSVVKAAPWIMTVGASAMDRQFSTMVKFGNGVEIAGLSVNTFSPKSRIYPLTSAGNAVNGSLTPDTDPWTCDFGTLDEKKVRGKIVLCKEGASPDYLKSVGVVGMIITLQEKVDTGFSFTLPAVYVHANAGDKIITYINSTKNPQAVIYKTKTTRNAATPFLASFSSRGPANVSSTILKPDIVAPGVDILAGYSKLISMTGSPDDNWVNVYNIISGTSMACPHVTGVAAYVKTFHPDWSPAAIKSALMTTAYELKAKDGQAELAHGAGHIDPIRALQPGLICNLSKSDYARFLCSEGYTEMAISLFTNENNSCLSLPNTKKNLSWL